MSNAFRADAALVRLVAEAHRLQHAYLFNPTYDLVVFDEAHKLSARYEPDGTVDTSKRYELAEGKVCW